jgi:hypothetical protein
MFLNSGLFWFFMGMITILVGVGFKAFANDRGWVMNWWKWVLSIIWYVIFSVSVLSFSTLSGENEGSAGVKILLLGLFICIVLGVGLWRLFGLRAKVDGAPE